MPIPENLLREIFNGPDVEPAKPKRGEEIFAGTDYPREWDGFIGQRAAKEQLRIQVASASARRARIEHTLLASGLHGVGKTTLATLLAYNAGVGFVQTTGPLTAADARAMMRGMEDRDILFIDEAHLLVGGNKNKADWLLPFMTEGVLYTDRGAEQMPDVTIVAATTDVGKLPLTLISRFMSQPQLVAYSDDEALEIVDNLGGRMGVPLDSYEDCLAVAQAADHNPRTMRRILTAVRDLQFAYPETHPNLGKAFQWANVSSDGLSATSRDILVLLMTSRDFTCSIESIRAHLGEPGPIKHHEQTLLQRGYITVTGRGRKLTDSGVRRAREEVDALRSNR